MNSRLILAISLVPVVLMLQAITSTAMADSSQPQWNQYSSQTCDPVNDPSTCKPG